jgi:hypothetical protein
MKIGVFEIKIKGSESTAIIESKFQDSESDEDFKVRFYENTIGQDKSVASCNLIKIYEVYNDR